MVRPENTRARFVVLNTPLQGRAFVMVVPVVTMGRSPECEIQLDLASVSRQHARVEDQGGVFIVRDMGSRNGIRIGGQTLQEAVLTDGDVLSIGDVQLRFEIPLPPSPAAASAPTSASVTAARPLTGMDIVAAAQGRGPAPGVASPADALSPPGPEDAPRAGLNVKLIIAVIFALILSGALGWFILRARATPSPKETKPGYVLLKVGENKWIYLRGYGDFSNTDIRSEDPVVADAERYDAGELLVSGRSGGETTITFDTTSGIVISVRVIVRGRLNDPLEDLAYGQYTSEERKALGAFYLKNGMLIEREMPYLARQEYEKAMAVLKGVPEKGELYLQVRDRLAGAIKTVDDRWNKLRGDIVVAFRNNDRPRQMQLLQEALKLIPDPNDPRHQKAQWHINKIVQTELDERAGRVKK